MKKKLKKAVKQYFKNAKPSPLPEKVQAAQTFLEEINYHTEQLTIALRHLANAIDNVRSSHLGEEQPATEKTYKAAVKGSVKVK